MRINLDKALDRWLQAGMIDRDAAEAIRAFERTHYKPFFARYAYILGGFSIVVGIVALVAANWRFIPDYLKLAGHFGASGLIAAALYWMAERKRGIAVEVLALISFGLVLTLIALIGQIYQIQSPLWVGLTSWMVLGSAIVLVFARSSFAMIVWLLALTVTVGALCEPVVEWLGNQAWVGDRGIPIMVALLGSYPAALFVGATLVPEGGQTRALTTTAMGFSLALIIMAASVTQIGWYDSADDIDDIGPFAARSLSCVWLALVAVMVLLIARRNRTREKFQALVAVVLTCLVAGLAPYLFAPVEFRPVAAILNIGLWAVVGWAGLVYGVLWVARLAIGLIALRILIVYFEVFGTLAQTGLGLIFSGIFVIAVTYGAVRLQNRLAERWGASS